MQVQAERHATQQGRWWLWLCLGPSDESSQFLVSHPSASESERWSQDCGSHRVRVEYPGLYMDH